MNMGKHILKTHMVDALEFTSELGAKVAGDEKTDGEPLKVGDHEVKFESGRGYRYNGSVVAFGDFLVTSNGVTQVMSAKQFHDTYEPKGK
jgi:hypothetical protein